MPRNRTPLREQSFRIMSLALIPVVAVIVFVVTFGSGSGGDPALGPLGVILLVILVVVLLGGLAIGLLVGRRLVGDRIELAFRAPDAKWRHGRVAVDHQSITLQPYFWQLRFPAGAPIVLRVHLLGEDTGRKPSARQWWSLNPQLRIVDLSTDQGQYEIAALPSHLRELRERLDEAPVG